MEGATPSLFFGSLCFCHPFMAFSYWWGWKGWRQPEGMVAAPPCTSSLILSWRFSQMASVTVTVQSWPFTLRKVFTGVSGFLSFQPSVVKNVKLYSGLPRKWCLGSACCHGPQLPPMLFGLWEIYPPFPSHFRSQLSHGCSLCPCPPLREKQASASLFPKLQHICKSEKRDEL